MNDPANQIETFPDGSKLVTQPDGSVLVDESQARPMPELSPKPVHPVKYSEPPPPLHRGN